MVALEHAIIHSPDSARQIGSSFIGDDDREVFLVSERLHEAGDLIGIPVLDHLILGADESRTSA